MRKDYCYQLTNGTLINIGRDPRVPGIKGFIPKPRPGVDPSATTWVRELLDGMTGWWNLGRLQGRFDDSNVTASLPSKSKQRP